MALKAKNSSLEEEQIEILAEHGKKLGGLDFSATLRVVINEWLEMKGLRVVDISETSGSDGRIPVPVILVEKIRPEEE